VKQVPIGLVGLLIALVLVQAPPAAAVTASGGSPNGRALYDIGDSITFLSMKNLERTLWPYSYTVDGDSGTTMAQRLPTIQQVVATTPPQKWVIELGTNDMLSGNPNWLADFQNEVGTVAGQRCVILITVSPYLSADAPTLDQQMWRVAQSNPTFHVLDWGNTEFSKPNWTNEPDDIHPSKKGSAELAKLEHQALRQMCPR
jgi:lysophospholipase L1-like esterase